MLIPSPIMRARRWNASLSRRVNANSQLHAALHLTMDKLIKKGEC